MLYFDLMSTYNEEVSLETEWESRVIRCVAVYGLH